MQTAVLADAAVGRDLLVSAQTGSGKTVAYGLAIAKNLLGDAERFERAAAPLALIVAPTRELALQVQRELAWLYQYADARVVSCVGGMDPRREQRELAAGAHIVVGTPGRLCDHLRRGRLDVSELKAVVLDEADEMLDLGFREDMEFILKTTPDTPPHAAVLGDLAARHRRAGQAVSAATRFASRSRATKAAMPISSIAPSGSPPSDVEHAVVNVLRFFESPSALVFCNTRNAVRHLQATLLERGFSVVALSGELTQNERTHALQSLRDGRARVCVATDVAARGIDLPNLDLVIHADLPNDPEVMQHRSGRTGRAGRKGVSVLLVPPARRRRAELLLNLAGIDAVWGTAPTAGGNPQARSGAHAEGYRCSPRRRPPTIWCWRRPCSPSGRPRISPRRWRGSIARGCRRRKTFSIPARAPAGRVTIAAGKESARPPRGEDRAGGAAAEAGKIVAASRAWRRAASGFAPPSAAGRTPKRAGCCR